MDNMKTTLITIAIATAITLISMSVYYHESHESLPVSEINVDGYHSLKVIPFEGHDYIVLHHFDHGSAIIHSESCKCKNK